MPKQIVVTGMHRSGTSLVASLVRHAGIDMGSQLMPGREGNPRGHFEDLDFINLHETLLARHGGSAFVLHPDDLAAPDAGAEATARALIERRSGRSLWGWKDPRTCLFLDFWHGLLPDPHYVFLYRHPVEVVLSLLLRGRDVEVRLDPLNGFKAWTVYNSKILDFYHRHPDRCLLWNISGFTRSIESALRLLAGRLGVGLQLGGLQELFHPDELRLGLSLPEIDWRVVIPQALDLYDRLEEAADLPAGPLAGAAEADSRKNSLRGWEARERELRQANEHLLYLLLKLLDPSATSGAARFPGSEFSEERPGAAAEGEAIRRLVAMVRAGEGTVRGLSGELHKLQLLLFKFERSRFWSFARAYWRVAAKLRALGHRASPVPAGRRPRSVAPPVGPGSGVDPERCLVGCVAENNPRYLEQACRLVQSIRWFGGGLARSKIMVCVVEGVEPAFRETLTRYGADVRIVSRFLAENPFANKLQFFGEAAGESCETMILLDCDTIVVQDPLPWIRSGSFQAKIADLPTVSHAVFKRLFKHYGLPLPERRYTTTFGDTRTIRFCNSGVLIVPVPLASRFIPVWRDFNARLSADLRVLHPCEKHCNQASLSLAFAAHPIPFDELPLPMNYPLHLTHVEAPPGFATIDPVILHYHDRVDSLGYLMPSPYPPAQARIELFNRRMRETSEALPRDAIERV